MRFLLIERPFDLAYKLWKGDDVTRRIHPDRPHGRGFAQAVSRFMRFD